ncbi:MAG: hypothetical protein C4584_02890 [Armatimonadetes bacterium]|nr:MAG: hypothetical protein C4584_02890 [Armatimonadota bacterium]
MPEPQIQVETPDMRLRRAKTVRLKTPHGAGTIIDCVGKLAIIRRRPWKKVSEKKPAGLLIEDEIVLEGDTNGPVQVIINDLARRFNYHILWEHVQEVVLGHRLRIPREIPPDRQGQTPEGIEFYVIADKHCMVIPAQDPNGLV